MDYAVAKHTHGTDRTHKRVIVFSGGYHKARKEITRHMHVKFMNFSMYFA